jgi:predicted site-specific integrase-resolvase
MTEPTWMTRREAAERAKVTDGTIDNWRRYRRLEFRKDAWGHVSISAESLERILNPKEGK